MASDGSHQEPVPQAFGPFRVLHQVGAGTLGPVFRAHDAAGGRLVAVKAFTFDLDPDRADDLARALDELKTRGLDHPSVAAPAGAGVDGTRVWFAQAYVPAESLESALRQYGPAPVPDALAVITHLAGALDFAAATGVLHGALHPRDVLVAPDQTHLIDLGVAQALESCGVRAPLRGPYSAPERLAGGPLTRAADVFALGAIAYELLTGTPVVGSGDGAVASMAPVPGANHEGLLETLAFALAAAPDERYTSALSFVAALKRALGEAAVRTGTPAGTHPGNDTQPIVPVPAAAVPTVAPPLADMAAAAASESADDGQQEAAAADEPPLSYMGRHDIAIVRGADTTEMTGPPADVPLDLPGPHVDPTPDALEEPLGSPESAPAEMPLHGPDDEVGQGVQHTGPTSFEPESHDHADMIRVVADDAHTGGRERRIGAPLAAALVLGILAGAVGGYVYGTRGRQSAAPDASASAAGTAGEHAREERATPAAAPASPPVEHLAPPEIPGSASTAEVTPPRAAAPAPADAQARHSEAPAPATHDTAPRHHAPEARQSRSAPVRGRLMVRSTPSGARVEVDGHARGTTPLAIGGLDLGTFSVRVTRTGYEPVHRRVTLSASTPSQTLELPLAKIEPRARAADRDSGNRGADRETGASAASFTGSVLFDSRPTGARIYLDNRLIGTTPLQLPDVRAGSHAVRLEKEGYVRWTASVQVVAGERTRVAASLEEVTGQ